MGEHWGQSGQFCALESPGPFYPQISWGAIDDDEIIGFEDQIQGQEKLLESDFQHPGEENCQVSFQMPQSCQEGIPDQDVTTGAEVPVVAKIRQGKLFSFPSSSVLKILGNYGDMFGKCHGETSQMSSCSDKAFSSLTNNRRLSVNAIIQLAGENFIQSSLGKGTDVPKHPFPDSVSALSKEDHRDCQLVQCLLASAEKVGQEQFGCARKLLVQCDGLSCYTGTPVQRLVYYFSEGLHEKIDRHTGKITAKGLATIQPLEKMEETLMTAHSTILAMHNAIPIFQVTQFAGIQAILEHVGYARKIHIIDLAIRTGMQWTILMQALAAQENSNLVHLRITAVSIRSKAIVEETGKHLKDFAESLGLPFSFNIVMIEDIQDLRINRFILEAREAIAVYAPYMNMIGQPDRLEYLMRLIKSLHPRVMVVLEGEGNYNSPVFVNRFTEALFYFGAFADSLEECMKQDESTRLAAEGMFLRAAVRNVVAAEGEERAFRFVTISVWRAFFARWEMREIELSKSSLSQALLLLKKCAHGASCTLEVNGKSLIIGWKGTPLESLSVWRFF